MKMILSFWNFQIMYTKLNDLALIEVLVAQSVRSSAYRLEGRRGFNPPLENQIFLEFIFESQAHQTSTHHCTEARG